MHKNLAFYIFFKMENLSEQLALEQLGKKQLEEKIEVLEANLEQQLHQKEAEAKLEVSVSPSEELLLRQRLTGVSSFSIYLLMKENYPKNNLSIGAKCPFL